MILKEHNFSDINGLVLAGGKSIRMGRAKDKIQFHDKQQRYYAADLLKQFCSKVFISCRPDQVGDVDIQSGYEPLPDTFLGMGPLSGILSAYRSDRENKTAWLVVACDLPLMSADTLRFLIKNRKSGQIATAFKSPHDDLPEPLITIWEPAGYAVLLAALAKGITCPRKTLIQTGIDLLTPPDKKALLNVNTPEEAGQAVSLLAKYRAKDLD
jgi:molybdopterin-guanine dinucleotide biosynthesis protein A